jgi:hypothetical protein
MDLESLFQDILVFIYSKSMAGPDDYFVAATVRVHIAISYPNFDWLYKINPYDNFIIYRVQTTVFFFHEVCLNHWPKM